MAQAASKRGVVVELKVDRSRRVRGHLVGSVVGRDERGLLVDYPGNPHGPLVARATVPDTRAPASASAAPAVLLVFEHERSDRPIVVGWIERSPVVRVDPGDARTGARLEALVDGRRVVLDAEDEIVLQCGEASITLRRNGRIVIRGAYVETRSRGVNRIKGGTVQIN
jgi:Domain of unknown function (DUF6484)